MTTIQARCRRILEGGTLADKLHGNDEPQAVDDVEGAVIVDVDVPARFGVLAMVEGAERLPALRELTRLDARVACLSRFAHHELMAVEMFAWALLRFPDAPRALRRGMWAALVEEQAHLGLYLDRMKAHGAAIGDVPLSGYFWKLMPPIRSAADPLKAFLCAQGLTLEQANLDFTITYRDAFSLAGDVDSAAVMQRVHDDEISHVRLARTWLCKGRDDDDDDDSDVDAYVTHVPFPLSAARAKGRRFESGARRRAGLSEPFIAFVRDARPYADKTPETTPDKRAEQT